MLPHGSLRYLIRLLDCHRQQVGACLSPVFLEQCGALHGPDDQVV